MNRTSNPPGEPGQRELETLEGVLERVSFQSDDDAWSVVRLAVNGRREPVTAVGNLLGVQPGESVRLRGRWTVDRRFGEQFQVESYLTVKPATLVGIERYLGSGLVPGIGRVMAERLVRHFGIDTLEVIEAHPERLAEVEGIGRVRIERIRAAWVEQREIKDVMVFLQSYGVSSAYAVRIYKRYKDRAIALVRENPYRLAVDVFGIGFKTADKLAASLGIEKTSPRRAEAGVSYVLGELAGEGHVAAPRDRLIEAATSVLEIDATIVEAAVRDLGSAGTLVVEPRIDEAGNAVYLRSLHAAEVGLAERLSALARAKAPALDANADRAIAAFEAHARIELAPEQRDAIGRALTSKLLVVTGGPGTGKTTLVNGIIRVLESRGLRVLLAAPTGRAAKRMSEATAHEARTLHRLLEFSPKTLSFLRDESAPLDADAVIVDETSMLDVPLAHDLLRAIPRACRLVLVGDVDQLPSVGPGSVLADVIGSGVVDVVRLSHIFRQAEASLIVTNAHRVNEGKMPQAADRPDADFFFIDRNAPEDVVSTLKTLLTERIPRRFGFDPVTDVQVLTPMNRGPLGTMALNQEIQSWLNPGEAGVVRGTRALRVGDKVMQTKNDYDRDVFNGDVGRVERIDEHDRTVHVRFEARTVAYELADLDELVLAYACSIHKSQGSEYPCVVVPLHTQHFVMLRRNLVYTAITRGRKLVVVVGNRRALELAIGNDRKQERFGQLAARLRRLSSS